MASMLTGWLLATLLGVRHASEPDHLMAVSTLVAGAPNARRAAWVGALWGLGHALALLLVGVGLMSLHRVMSERVAALFELGVAAMLLLLGALSIARAIKLGRKNEHPPHRHTTASDHVHVSTFTLARRPLLIGMVHGLAGSGALSALALANMPSFASAVVYIVCFGAGSVLGMMALAGLAGMPLALLSRKASVQVWLFCGAGVGSVVLGVLWGWPLLRQI